MKIIIFSITLLLSNFCLSNEAVLKLERRGDLYFKENDQLPFTGVYTDTSNDGRKGELVYQSGVPTLMTTWHPNGQKLQIAKIEKGQWHGTVTWWYDDGQVAKEEGYQYGIKQGPSSQYYPNGKIQKQENYSNGNLDGLITSWHPNGQKESEVTYKPYGRVGVRVGKRVTWYSNGQIKSEEFYSNSGTFEGLFVDWYENGQKKEEANFKNGKLIGSITKWDEDGNKLTSDERDFPFLDGDLNLAHEGKLTALAGEVVEIKDGPDNKKCYRLNLPLKDINDIWVLPIAPIEEGQVKLGDSVVFRGYISAVDSFKGSQKQTIKSIVKAPTLLLALKLEPPK